MRNGGGGALLAAAGIMGRGQRLPLRQKTASSSPTEAAAEGDDVPAVHTGCALRFMLAGKRLRIIADLFSRVLSFLTTHTGTNLGCKAHTFKYFGGPYRRLIE